MESATAIFYSDVSVTGDRSVRWRNVVIHEVAHQWFGNCVTEYDWDDVWLSEGFATYFTLMFREHAYGRDDFVNGLNDAKRLVYNHYKYDKESSIVHNNLKDMKDVDQRDAFRNVIKTIGLITFITNLTTAVGFLV